MYPSKDKVRVAVIAGSYRIEGDLHLLPGSRITDAMNSKADSFLAMTDASITRGDLGAPVERPSYIAINRGSIDAVFPL